MLDGLSRTSSSGECTGVISVVCRWVQSLSFVLVDGPGVAHRVAELLRHECCVVIWIGHSCRRYSFSNCIAHHVAGILAIYGGPMTFAASVILALSIESQLLLECSIVHK